MVDGVVDGVVGGAVDGSKMDGPPFVVMVGAMDELLYAVVVGAMIVVFGVEDSSLMGGRG